MQDGMDLDAPPVADELVIASTENIDHGSYSEPSTTAFLTQIRKPSNSPDPSQVLPFALQPLASAANEKSIKNHESSQQVSSLQRHVSSTNAPGLGTSRELAAIPPPKDRNLQYATGSTGIVYDPRMRFHVNLGVQYEQRDQRLKDLPEDLDHPEKPARIAEIFHELRDAGLVEDPNRPDLKTDFMMKRIAIRPATVKEITMIHTLEHVDFVKSLAGMDEDDLKRLNEGAQHEVSMYYHNLSWLCASLAAGGAIEATRAVVSGKVSNAVAVIRPPGHHAEHGEASGFCFFNNVCIAARVVQREFPESCRRILILDWDVHHGNGVQRAFYDDPNILYISLHVYAGGRFYPNGDFGDHVHCGNGPGLGKSVNIPWTTNGMTDADYVMAFQQVVMPIAVEFDPDLVIISAGFDAAEGDPLGDCHVSPAGFGHMTHMLMQLAKGKVVACLEGGYNLRSIAVSALAMTRVLMGEPPDRIIDLTPTPSAVNVIHQVVRTQSRFWKCLYPKDMSIRRKQELKSERLHDIVREWQSKQLWENFYMTKLFILRQQISRSFNDQVLATPNYAEHRPLLVLFHDPPEVEGYPDPRTNRLELHNTFLTDVSKTYIDWAVKNQFAVIDVNVPKHITASHDTTEGYTPADGEAARAAAAKEVAFYLWDNYIEVNASSHVVLMGIGDSYSAVVELLSNHPTAFFDVDLSISFVAEHVLRSVQRPGDESAALRYHANSLVFVSENHAAFMPERIRKLKRRYGCVLRSKETELQEMLHAHKPAVTERLLELTADWRLQQQPIISPSIDVLTAHERLNDMGLGASGSSDEDGEEDAALHADLKKWKAQRDHNPTRKRRLEQDEDNPEMGTRPQRRTPVPVLDLSARSVYEASPGPSAQSSPPARTDRSSRSYV